MTGGELFAESGGEIGFATSPLRILARGKTGE
jgi:hypothetical protein